MATKTSSFESDTPVSDLGKVRVIHGDIDGSGLRIGIVVSRYNHDFTHRMLEGALECLAECGTAAEDITVTWVPGAYEITAALHELAKTGGFNALIGIGVVIQGETEHARLINEQVSQCFARITMECRVPVMDGVLPAATVEQAEVRAQGGIGGRGGYLAKAAIEMARVYEQIRAGSL